MPEEDEEFEEIPRPDVKKYREVVNIHEAAISQKVTNKAYFDKQRDLKIKTIKETIDGSAFRYLPFAVGFDHLVDWIEQAWLNDVKMIEEQQHYINDLKELFEGMIDMPEKLGDMAEMIEVQNMTIKQYEERIKEMEKDKGEIKEEIEKKIGEGPELTDEDKQILEKEYKQCKTAENQQMAYMHLIKKQNTLRKKQYIKNMQKERKYLDMKAGPGRGGKTKEENDDKSIKKDTN